MLFSSVALVVALATKKTVSSPVSRSRLSRSQSHPSAHGMSGEWMGIINFLPLNLKQPKS